MRPVEYYKTRAFHSRHFMGVLHTDHLPDESRASVRHPSTIEEEFFDDEEDVSTSENDVLETGVPLWYFVVLHIIVCSGFAILVALAELVVSIFGEPK